MTKQQLEFDRFYQSFFYTLLQRRPVSASFLGRHEFDDMLPDYSPKACAETIGEMEQQLTRSLEFDCSSLTERQRLDKRLLEGYLEIQLWEFSSMFFQKGNPSLYTGEAVFGLLVCILTDYAPAPLRYRSMAKRMEQFPDFFAQAKANVTSAPVEWTKRALRECQAGLDFLRYGLPRACKKDGIDVSSLEGSVAVASEALSDYKTYLENELINHPREQVAAGREVLQLIMDKGHFADVTLEQQLTYAQAEVDKATAYLSQHAADFDAASISEALGRLSEIHPEADGYLNRFQQIWDAAEALVKDNNLLTWPEFPIEYINQYEWAKECAPSLYFLFYRAPAAFNRPRVMEYIVPPLRPGEKSPEELEAFLRANNDEVIKNNHVVHHGSFGHHVQNYNAYHQENSLIGQFAGCDAASRPIMLCSGTMIEGWAVYATRLAGEYGFHTPLEAYAEVQSHRRMAARTVVDIKLHLGEFTLEQAAAYYMENTGMNQTAAMGEAVKNSMFPGGAVIYLYGCDVIFKFRQEVRDHMGDSFSICRFHDDFLSYGSIPVALVCNELRRKYGMV